MKKKLLVLGTTVLMVLGAKAQQSWVKIKSELTQDQKIWFSGKEMQTYYKHHNTGLILGVGGAALSLLGNNILIHNSTYKKGPFIGMENNFAKDFGGAFLVIGGITSLIGTIIVIEAPCHIKNAGLILSGNGVGLTIKI